MMLKPSIALFLFIASSFANAGAMYKGHCYLTADDATTAQISEINGSFFADGSYFQFEDKSVNGNSVTLYGYKIHQNPPATYDYSLSLTYPQCEDSFDLVGVSPGTISIAIGAGFALVFSLAFLGYGLGIALKMIRRI